MLWISLKFYHCAPIPRKADPNILTVKCVVVSCENTNVALLIFFSSKQVQLFLHGCENRFGMCLSVNVMEENINPSRALHGIFTWRRVGGVCLSFFSFFFFLTKRQSFGLQVMAYKLCNLIYGSMWIIKMSCREEAKSCGRERENKKGEMYEKKRRERKMKGRKSRI